MKAAVIGLGAMGRRHVAALSRVEAARLAAACDLRAEALAWDGLSADVGRFARPNEMLDAVRPDLVVVATTAPSHLELVQAALASGARRILVEKPIACSVASAVRMIEACRTAGAALAVNHCRRHVPAYQWLAERIASGEWGELRGMRVGVPGIGLGCLGTHFLDLMRMLSGEELTAVSGWVDEERGRNPRGDEFHDPGGLVVALGSRGTRFVLHQVEDGSGPVSLTIDLTAARVMVEESARTVLVTWRDRSAATGPGLPPRFEPVPLPEGSPLSLDLVALSADVLRELAAGEPPTCAAVHGLRSLEAVVAAHLSHERGNVPVALPLAAAGELERELPIT